MVPFPEIDEMTVHDVLQCWGSLVGQVSVTLPDPFYVWLIFADSLFNEVQYVVDCKYISLNKSS
jgi:hypothetical protein